MDIYLYRSHKIHPSSQQAPSTVNSQQSTVNSQQSTVYEYQFTMFGKQGKQYASMISGQVENLLGEHLSKKGNKTSTGACIMESDALSCLCFA
jgi:hypothetical protein